MGSDKKISELSVIEEDFINHGYDTVQLENGTYIFSTTKKDYYDRIKSNKKLKEIHKTHPIWFDEDEKNINNSDDSKSVVIIKTICANCGVVAQGHCPQCGVNIPIPTAKPHIPWKHELTIDL